MAELLEFGSAAWVEAARKLIERLVAESPDDEIEGVRFAVCEVYTHVPEHLEPDSEGRRSWHFRIRGREVELQPGEIDDADFKVVGEYAAILPLARLHYGRDPGAVKKAAQLARQASQAGKLEARGERAKGPRFLAGFHDALAEITA